MSKEILYGEDARKKLLEGIKDSDSGNVCTIDEVFGEVEAILG